MLMLLLACGEPDPAKDALADTADTAPVDDGDRDGDGVPDEADCDPDNNNVYPGHAEIPYNGRDDDCDGEDLTDADGDGYDGDAVEGGTDCLDNNASVNPGAPEVCYNGLDDNCDGFEGGNDCDGDGWAHGYDCDEENPDVHPEAEETWYDGIDSDCEGDDDFDQDHDGEPRTDEGGTDCDDLDPLVNAAADETWNGTDDDCDGVVDTMTDEVRLVEAVGNSGDGEGMFGAALAFVEDLDADGRRDLAVGVPQSGEYAGRVWVLPTADGSVTSSREGLGVADGAAASVLGASLLTTSVTGTALLAVGAPAWGDDKGAVYLLSPSAFSGGPAAGDVGGAVATLAHAEAGGVLAHTAGGSLVVGCATGAVSTALSVWSSVGRGNFGLASASFSVQSDMFACLGSGVIGDADGDGSDEIAVVVDRGDRGVALLLLWSSMVDIGGAWAASDFDALEGSGLEMVTLVSSVSDVDGDGYADTVLSAPAASGASSGEGRVYLIPGSAYYPLPTDVIAEASASVSGGSADAALRATSLADLDRDGADELLLGAPGRSELFFLAGADLASGGELALTRGVPSFSTVSSSHQLGTTALGEDFDGDGDDDLVIATGRVPGGLFLFRHD